MNGVDIMLHDAVQGVNSVDLPIGRDKGVGMEGGIDGMERMEQFIFQGERRAWEVVMTELHSICDDNSVCDIGKHLVTPVVVEGWTEVERSDTQ